MTIKLFQCTDLYNGNVWYSKNCKEMKKQAKEYIDKHEENHMLCYMVYDYLKEEYRIMSIKEVKDAGFPL